MGKYYVTGYVGEGAKRMFCDLRQCEQVILLDEIITEKWKRFFFFRAERFTKGFKRFGWLKKLFYSWYAVFRIKEHENSCMIFVNSLFVTLYDSQMIQKLRKKYPTMKMVLYIVDPMEGFCNEDNLKVISMMDKVYSVHRSDCEKYDFQHHVLVYSVPEMVEKENECLQEKADIYYLGSGTDRTAYLEQIAKKCESLGIRIAFHVVSGQEQSIRTEKLHFYNQPLSYDENVGMIQSSKCILEIMHEGFQGATQRYMEAVVFGKRLLTNNEKIAELEFYRPEYMQIFHSPEEIRKEFLESAQIVDYGYQGEFSPVHFVEKIQRDLNEDADKVTI